MLAHVGIIGLERSRIVRKDEWKGLASMVRFFEAAARQPKLSRFNTLKTIDWMLEICLQSSVVFSSVIIRDI